MIRFSFFLKTHLRFEECAAGWSTLVVSGCEFRSSGDQAGGIMRAFIDVFNHDSVNQESVNHDSVVLLVYGVTLVRQSSLSAKARQ
jgi:hypothetical protein